MLFLLKGVVLVLFLWQLLLSSLLNMLISKVVQMKTGVYTQGVA